MAKDKKFLKDTNDVVLDFLYKDCVLVGGQSTEEGLDNYFEYDETITKAQEKQGLKAQSYNQKTAKRKEIFFNQTLAKDEIDRLYDPKALTNWKRFFKDGEQEVQEIKRDEDGTIKENLIIKGENLLALHSLKKQFAGKVKLIYIDPPYNTGNNGFKYNDNFSRSTWLTFMKNRLEIARELLRDDGVIAVSIDENEQAFLKILLNNIFDENNFISTVIVQNNSKGRVLDKNISTSHEYLFLLCKKELKQELSLPKTPDEIKKQYPEKDEKGFYRSLELRNTHREYGKFNRKNLFYPIYVNKENGNISLEKKDDFIEVYPTWEDGFEGCWTWGKEKTKNEASSLYGKLVNDNWKIYRKSYALDKNGDVVKKKLKSIWLEKEFLTDKGRKDLDELLVRGSFYAPKPKEYLKQIVNLVTVYEKNAIVLDFFAGSGTTAHAVLELNKEDGGNRKFIMIEQMDFINTVTCPRVHKVMEKENIDDSYIYFELAKWNETAKEKIQEAKSLEELIKFFDEMYERYFLNYNLKIKEFREKVIKEEEFKNLTLEEQKKMFITMLYNNQMYVNKTEMADSKYGIDKKSQNLTELFYKK